MSYRYRSVDEDSGRWIGFPFRDGDIVISTRSKSGTTWVQMICALLIFQTPKLPARLATLSPWLDWVGTPRDEIYEHLAAQRHRRFIKTHTPLNGVPMDDRAIYIVVARHPLDMAVSLYHQGGNLDRDRLSELTGQSPDVLEAERPPLREWLVQWIDKVVEPREELDSLAGVMWHLSDAWARRREPNVVLMHYDDLSADLEGEMRRLAELLDIVVPDDAWPGLVWAASFMYMRKNADLLAPDPSGIMRSKQAFFRQGSSGAGRELLTDDELARYWARVAQLAPPEMIAWLHREQERNGPRVCP